LFLKYIFLEGINDNVIDTDGFYETVKKLGAVMVFAADSRNIDTVYTEKIKMLVCELIKKAKSDNVAYAADSSSLSMADQAFIESVY